MKHLVLRVMMSTVVSATAINGVVAASGDEISDDVHGVIRTFPANPENHPVFSSKVFASQKVAQALSLYKLQIPQTGAALYVLKSKESHSAVQAVRTVYDSTRHQVYDSIKVQPVLEEKSPNGFVTAMANTRAWIQGQKAALADTLQDYPAVVKANFVEGFQSFRQGVAGLFGY